MYRDVRDWSLYNPQLVNRGRPSTYINSALAHYQEDLLVLNRGKVGAPYLYTMMLIVAGFAAKSVFKIGYREASGVGAEPAIPLIDSGNDIIAIKEDIAKQESKQEATIKEHGVSKILENIIS